MERDWRAVGHSEEGGGEGGAQSGYNCACACVSYQASIINCSEETTVKGETISLNPPLKVDTSGLYCENFKYLHVYIGHPHAPIQTLGLSYGCLK